jgi:hypothetical protein
MEPEIIEISMDNDYNSYNSKTFGPGIELLMNDKVKEGKNINIGIEDLNDLENELNDLDNRKADSYVQKSDLFSPQEDKESHSVKFVDELKTSNVFHKGKQDAEQSSWDGYAKFNNIPINPEREISTEPKLSREETLREKFKYLRKFESLEKKGVELTTKYNMESSLSEMQGEYESIMEEKAKDNSIKFQGNMLMSVINGIEFLNSRFDPFDIKLDGWSEQINENLNDYDSVFGELHEKYQSKASLAPELKLLFQLGGSAMMVHMTNTMFKSAMPGMDDIFRQNPDLMRSFQSATVNAMGKTNPGLSGFMNDVMSDSQSRGPPPPMPTQGPNSAPAPSFRPGNNNASQSMSNQSFREDGIQFQEKNTRPEMKGPSDIGDILSGIKTKTIEVQNQNNDSTISISDLKSLQSEGNAAKKSRRRQKSDKAVSLDF